MGNDDLSRDKNLNNNSTGNTSESFYIISCDTKMREDWNFN